MAKRTKITIETENLLILGSRSSQRAWCPLCTAEVEMVALEDVGVLSNLLPAELSGWLNAADLHQTRTADGSELICLNSLLARVRTNEI